MEKIGTNEQNPGKDWDYAEISNLPGINPLRINFFIELGIYKLNKPLTLSPFMDDY